MTELDAQLARRKLATITRNLDLLAAVEGLAARALRGQTRVQGSRSRTRSPGGRPAVEGLTLADYRAASSSLRPGVNARTV